MSLYQLQLFSVSDSPRAMPHYQLRVRRPGGGPLSLEVWQLPALATPHLKAPLRIAGVTGRSLEAIETRVLRRLHDLGIDATKDGTHDLDEQSALVLGLLFRVLAPMRNAERMRACAVAIETMSREEAAYWLGMAMHRKRPRLVLTALRILLMAS